MNFLCNRISAFHCNIFKIMLECEKNFGEGEFADNLRSEIERYGNKNGNII